MSEDRLKEDMLAVILVLGEKLRHFTPEYIEQCQVDTVHIAITAEEIKAIRKIIERAT